MFKKINFLTDTLIKKSASVKVDVIIECFPLI